MTFALRGATSKRTSSGIRIGVLVPFTNTNLEPDLMEICPVNCTLHFQRTGGYDADAVPDKDQMTQLGVFDLSHDLEMIKGAQPDVVLYGCTSATLTHGPSFDRDLAIKIKEKTGASTFTAAGSIVAGLKALNVQRIGFASPYVGNVNDRAAAFLEESGMAVVSCADVGRDLGCYGQGLLSPQEIYQLAMKANDPNVEAIVLSCTDMRAMEVIEEIEKDLGKPVVTSNQAMMFCVYKTFKFPKKINCPGYLFNRL